MPIQVETRDCAALTDGSIQVDAELVCQAQYLSLAYVEVDRRVSGVLAKNLSDLVNFQLVE